MSPLELTTFITAVANLIAKEQPDDLALLAAMFTQLGDTLATISTLNSSDKPQ